MIGYNEEGRLVTFNNGQNNFVWKGKRYGINTIIKIKEDFRKSFRWKGEEIPSMGRLHSILIRDGQRMYQFEKYCPYEWKLEKTYPACFSFTELELLDAIEEVTRATYVEELTAAKPPFAEKQLSNEFKKNREFFVRNEKYYGSGSKMHITDEFMECYRHKTGKRLTKKIMFSHVDCSKEKPEYWMVCIDYMKRKEYDDYEFVFSLTEEEFYKCIEIITDCHTIKYKDTDEPIVFIFWALLIAAIWLSCIVFADARIIVALLLFGFYKIRQFLLRQ